MFKLKSNPMQSVRRHGLSLVEVMIAMVMTLVVLGAMMAAFAYGSREMQRGRGGIELNNRLITAEELLRRDLDRITVELKPHHQLPTNPKGYVEIVDGANIDYIAGNDLDTGGVSFPHGGNELVFGDRDDYFACTIQSNGKPFRGRFGNQIVESHLAEVAWFTVFDASTADTSDVLLIRRQLLILPDLAVTAAAGTYSAFLANNDISVRREGGVLVPNSLTDLAVRGNRFSHAPTTGNPAAEALEIVPLGVRFNDNHIMFSSVAAFDVQVFAPDAGVNVITDTLGTDVIDIAEPSDVGANKTGAIVGTTAAISGAYVDLGKATGFLGSAMRSSANCNYAAAGQVLYDTGTSEYNRASVTGNGSDGFDDAGVGGVVDDWQEQTSIAPYDTPIRGLQFTMRAIEPNTNQVRQLTVRKSFVLE